MGTSYDRFIGGKIASPRTDGIPRPASVINPKLFDFQRDIVSWALRLGRGAIFADCGLGKTPMQLVWADEVSRHSGMPVLIFAPLAVAAQTHREGAKFDVHVTVCRSQKDVRPGVNIANYEMLEHFDASEFAGIVLDESSILKAYDGKTRRLLTEFGQAIEYRLACTATPAPNDLAELCNHAEFLGLMRESEVKALFFTQDGNDTTQWRLKGHAHTPFYQWMATWCVAMRRPSDLGYEDGAFKLPECSIEIEEVDHEWRPDGQLFASEAITLQDQRQARRDSLPQRVEVTAAMVNASSEPWLLWCDLNDESAALAKAIPDSVEVKGSDSNEHKEQSMLGFSDGSIRVLVTKPTIAGFGMNWQHCANMAFVGIGHSYEQMYQAIRRCWRFGQTRDVSVKVVTSSSNRRVVANIHRKEAQSKLMMEKIVAHMRTETIAQLHGSVRNEMDYRRDVRKGETWTAHLGDCVDVTHELEDNSIGLSVFSPPFPGMYVYSNSMRDMGNVTRLAEMIEHFRFLAEPLLRKTMPGRSCCVHLTQTLAKKMTDGYTGMKDFRGQVIQMFEECGWVYYGEVAIDKNPQVKAIRTKDAGLLFKSLATDSAKMHMALADYVLQFRKPGDNPEPIKAGISEKYGNHDGWITPEEWIRWARPVWYAQDWAPNGDGIAETDVLNVEQARDTNDERHLAPLQLGVIERCVKLWSAPGDLVYSPFMGIGSEGYIAVKQSRRFVGAELKEGYWTHAVRHLQRADGERLQGSLFGGMAP